VPRLVYQGRAIELGPNESALDALERDGAAIPHSCRAGACQACLMRVVSGECPPGSQTGLRDALRVSGFVLACQAVPTADLELAPAGEVAGAVRATIAATERIAPDVARVELEPATVLSFRAGQFVTLFRADGLARSYSLASLPDEPRLELHVRVLPKGRMSQWLGDAACVGADVELRGPSGACFYVPERRDDPLLLAGTGTGLAPLWGIARDALARGHSGPIRVVHGARTRDGLYLTAELRALARRHDNVRYEPSVLDGEPAPDLHVGPIDDVVLRGSSALAGHRVYLCGDPTFVRRLQKKAFLGGARLSDIAADAFVTAPAPT
jgi:CDP-4-dehydro-6-deoxyglucose reductase